MKCIYCGNEDSKVLDSRPTENGIRRRRECLVCNKRFTTHEIVEKSGLMVEKNDGKLEEYNADKIRKSLNNVFKHRNFDQSVIEEIISDCNNYFNSNVTRKVTSRQIGNYILRNLKGIDKIAYIRFASFFYNFERPEEYLTLIQNM